jgi:hypothetical protein
VAKLTLAEATPEASTRAFSTRAAQEAQCIPVTGSSQRTGAPTDAAEPYRSVSASNVSLQLPEQNQ